MKVKFYGTRGSLAVSYQGPQLREKILELVRRAVRRGVTEADLDEYLDRVELPATNFFGGNTSCVALEYGAELIVLDAGSGLRVLGAELMAAKRFFFDRPLHILVSHYHWDHICGFPFFVPAYVPNNRITVCSALPRVRRAFATQQRPPFFPVGLNVMSKALKFRSLPAGRAARLGSAKVSHLPMRHPNPCAGYRVETAEGTVVYMTDTEILGLKGSELIGYSRFVDGADVVIADSQYTFLENIEKISYGHSSIVQFIDICAAAKVGRLVMFHHDPLSDDAKISEMLEAAVSYQRLNATEAEFPIVAAYDGLILEV